MARTKHSIDYIQAGLTLALLAIGLVMLWSASTTEAERQFGDGNYFITHQLMYGVSMGLLAMYVCSRIDYHFWKKIIPIALVLTLVALVLVKVPGLGITANGATRWLDLGLFVFQPSEAAKLAVIFYLAGWIASRTTHSKDFKQSVLPPLIMLGLYGILILWQPDMGTVISIGLVALIMLFAGGTRIKYLAGVVGASILALLVLIKLEPYRANRITAFFNRAADPQGIAYQINQALIAVGSGGWFGYGYGYSRQKHFYLPEALNDSIFAVMAEELGFVRIALILLLFLVFILRGLRLSLRAPDTFGKMLAVGIVAGIGANVVVNISAIIGLIPLTGIPLPFFSYGSSALIITLASVGILLNISRQSKQHAP